MVSSTALLLWWFVSPCSAGLFVGFFPLPSSDVQVCPSVFVCFATLVDTMKKQNQCCGIASNVICYAFFRLASIARMVRSRASSLWAFGKRVRKCVCVSVCCVWSGMALQTTHRPMAKPPRAIGYCQGQWQPYARAGRQTTAVTQLLQRPLWPFYYQ